ncbi:helix-turn-helix domain-containing protein [Pararobbsia silviterrae]|uniref:AraC family transcriptional regulator n=1 Tax=Pararobbsia silviterrae TaxID=1792498 RepID=A0A494XSL3_9BURK|nr:AraC family transcriptional regulator [Pararobbsia silviterrae]RKP53632.1 AraC family transcriptional regulator [Pararobbsia silviterrae]
MKPAYEHVEFGDHCSVRVYHRRLPRIPFEWHHHPEYELTLTLNSQGKRYIGDSIGEYHANDLVLVPPDLPHTWASNRSIDPSAQQVAIVIWFQGEWARRLADCCPEYAALRKLLRRAACGLAFDASASALVQSRLDRLLSDDARRRLAAALDILCDLADAPGDPLASPSSFRQEDRGPTGHEPERFARVLATIETRFAEALRVSDLCDAANVSERSLSRYFEHHIGESVGRYIARIRIGHACRLLSNTVLPVSVIAARSGFPNVANFNRQFKALRKMTPSQFRAQFPRGARQDEAVPELTQRPRSLEHASAPKPARSRAPKPASPSGSAARVRSASALKTRAAAQKPR